MSARQNHLGEEKRPAGVLSLLKLTIAISCQKDISGIHWWPGARTTSRSVRLVNSLDRTAHAGIGRALVIFQSLKRVPRHEPLRILALFSVVEMLITHLPGGTEVGDSIGHQLRTKMVLLAPRFSQPLDYSQFGGASPERTPSMNSEARSRTARRSISAGGRYNY